MLRDAPMAAMRKLCRSICEAEGPQFWTGFDVDPSILNFYALGNGERVLKLYTKVSDGTVHFGMAE